MNDDIKHDYRPPSLSRVGSIADWKLPLEHGTGRCEEFRGQFLGLGSSHRDTHINHEGHRFAPKGTPCSGCRWFESRIFVVRESDVNDRFLLYTVGQSIVDDEEPRYRAEWAVSPYEVIDLLTTFRPSDQPGGQRQQSLSYAARRALAQAANFNNKMRDAYEGRTAIL
jgi:hypothetical protein